MTIVLMALTGFANPILAALVQAGQAPHLLVTRAEPGPFPHYELPSAGDEATRWGVPVLYGAEGEAEAARLAPDLLLCATYHRLLPGALLARVGRAINLHPSLLPRYRGPNPFYWVLRHGEVETGVTAHELTDQVDAGDVCWSAALTIAPDETQGSLRRRLGRLAASGALAVVEAAAQESLIGRQQDHLRASWQPRPGDADRMVATTLDPCQFGRQIRALCPYPGASVAGRRVVALLDIVQMDSGRAPGTILRDTADEITIAIRDGWARLHCAVD